MGSQQANLYKVDKQGLVEFTGTFQNIHDCKNNHIILLV